MTTKTTPKIADLVEVSWWDAFTYDGWDDPEEIVEQYKDEPGKATKSVGYVGSFNTKNIILFQSVGLNQAGNIWVIPKGMIKSIEVIRPATASVIVEENDGNN